MGLTGMANGSGAVPRTREAPEPLNPTTTSGKDPEAKRHPRIARLKARADDLAASVRERHAEALQAQAAGDEARATVLFSELERLNRRCNQANRAWLRLVLAGTNAQQG